VIASSSVEELWDIAQAARYTNDGVIARRVLLGLRRRFPATHQAENAAFLLGRLAMDDEGDVRVARQWFEHYLETAPGGALAEEALGRLVDVCRRSGNRGRCAQVCRTQFQSGSRSFFPFSCRDLCLGRCVADLRAVGVRALKIEGRMKDAMYVRNVVRLYRRLLDSGGELSEMEYAALFLGPGGHVSPHESVYVDGGGQLMGEATVAVRNYIEACGFEYNPDYHGLPDHISTELEFMAEVTRQEAVAWQERDFAKTINCLEFEAEFLDRHLGRWVPAFCERVLERAELPFYRRIIELARNFLDDEVGEINRRLTLAKSALEGNLPAFASEGHC